VTFGKSGECGPNSGPESLTDRGSLTVLQGLDFTMRIHTWVRLMFHPECEDIRFVLRHAVLPMHDGIFVRKSQLEDFIDSKFRNLKLSMMLTMPSVVEYIGRMTVGLID
jgi:hypothetical protein